MGCVLPRGRDRPPPGRRASPPACRRRFRATTLNKKKKKKKKKNWFVRLGHRRPAMFGWDALALRPVRHRRRGGGMDIDDQPRRNLLPGHARRRADRPPVGAGSHVPRRARGCPIDKGRLDWAAFAEDCAEAFQFTRDAQDALCAGLAGKRAERHGGEGLRPEGPSKAGPSMPRSRRVTVRSRKGESGGHDRRKQPPGNARPEKIPTLKPAFPQGRDGHAGQFLVDPPGRRRRRWFWARAQCGGGGGGPHAPWGPFSKVRARNPRPCLPHCAGAEPLSAQPPRFPAARKAAGADWAGPWATWTLWER